MKKSFGLYGIIFVVLSSLTVIHFASTQESHMISTHSRPLRYWFWWPIKTFDTFEADTPPVMQVARNIYATLVSNFIDGKVKGILAKSWEVDDEGKTWVFHLRSDLTFDDGTPITPELILANFRRILWLTKNDGLVLNSLLPGLSDWKHYHSPLPSISINQNTLVFHFNKRPINLFEALGQPIYGIAHPKCFDEEGKWKDPYCSSASGQYRVSKVKDDVIELESRGVFESVPNAPVQVEIRFPKNGVENVVQALLNGQGDLTVEHSFAMNPRTVEELKSKGLRITEEPPVRMHFVHLNAKRPSFQDRNIRQSIRDSFLTLLKADPHYKAASLEVNPSFIPRGGVGYRDFEISSATHNQPFSEKSVEILLYPISGDANIQTSIESNLLKALETHGFKPKITRYSERSEAFDRMRKGDFDVIVRGTGILVDDPYGDLRMMFMSKVGAHIPDVSGHIPRWIEAAEIESAPVKRASWVEKINTSLFDEASIITFAHSKLFYIHSENVDLSRHNLFADPIEFRAVGWKVNSGS